MDGTDSVLSQQTKANRQQVTSAMVKQTKANRQQVLRLRL